MQPTQTKVSQISLFVGVTGHRDIVDDGVAKIRVDIRAKLVSIESISKNVRPILLSGLAEGGDQLVAEEALKRNWAVCAVFPMPFSDFLEDFTSENARKALLSLKGQCKQVIEMPWALTLDADITDPRDQQYRNQSIFIARQSQLVIALWDGTPAQPSGACGTAYVVELCRKGPPPIEDEVLAAPETTSLIHIPVRRQSVPDRKPVLEAKPPATDRLYINICKEFGSYNRAAEKLCRTKPQNIKQSKDWLISETCVQTLNVAAQTLIDQYACADGLAIDRQTTRNRVVKVASVATIFAAVAQATNGLLAQTSWMIVYAIAAGLAYGLYLILFKLPFYRTEDRYLEYRALAEALRVQVFWRLAGLTAEAAEHYLQLVKTEVGWVREALRSISLQALIVHSDRTIAVEVVKEFWVNDQIKYFVGEKPDLINGKSLECKNLQKWLDFAANSAMVCGGILVGAASATSIYALPPDMKAAASAYSATFFLFGGVLKAYAAAMGYADQAISYEKMGAIFRGAKRILEQDQRRQNECLFALGKQALAENAEWLLQHRKNAFKVQS